MPDKVWMNGLLWIAISTNWIKFGSEFSHLISSQFCIQKYNWWCRSIIYTCNMIFWITRGWIWSTQLVMICQSFGTRYFKTSFWSIEWILIYYIAVLDLKSYQVLVVWRDLLNNSIWISLTHIEFIFGYHPFTFIFF